MKDPIEYPNIAPAGQTMYHYCDDYGRILGGIWKSTLTSKYHSYVASSGKHVQTHPSFEAAYIALKMRTK